MTTKTRNLKSILDKRQALEAELQEALKEVERLRAMIMMIDLMKPSLERRY